MELAFLPGVLYGICFLSFLGQFLRIAIPRMPSSKLPMGMMSLDPLLAYGMNRQGAVGGGVAFFIEK